jgi:hypothetical protein
LPCYMLISITVHSVTLLPSEGPFSTTIVPRLRAMCLARCHLAFSCRSCSFTSSPPPCRAHAPPYPLARNHVYLSLYLPHSMLISITGHLVIVLPRDGSIGRTIIKLVRRYWLCYPLGSSIFSPVHDTSFATPDVHACVRPGRSDLMPRFIPTARNMPSSHARGCSRRLRPSTSEWHARLGASMRPSLPCNPHPSGSSPSMRPKFLASHRSRGTWRVP